MLHLPLVLALLITSAPPATSAATSVGAPGVDPTGVADSTAGLNAMLSTLPVNGGDAYIGPGIYLISSPLLVRKQVIIRGAGKFATQIKLSGAGTVGFQSATPAVCATSGAGACTSAINTSAKGIGCVCYSNSDCSSGTCTPGSSSGNAVRYAKIQDLGVTLTAANQFAFDLAGISETQLDNVFVIQSGSIGGTHASPSNTGCFLFSDLDGAFTGYENMVSNSHCAGPDATHLITWGARVLPRANDNKLFNVMLGNNVDTTVMVDSQVTGTAASAFLVLASTCQTPGTVCVDDHGRGLRHALNYSETANTHLLEESDAKVPTSIGNYDTTSTAPYSINASTTDPFVLNAQGATLSAVWSNSLPGGNSLGILPFYPPTIAFANLGTPANGAVAYCSNCTAANPCATGGTGALAKRLNSIWVCN